MRDVAVIGVGMTKIGKFPDRMLSAMGREAVLAAIKDAGVPPRRFKQLIRALYWEGRCWGSVFLRTWG